MADAPEEAPVPGPRSVGDILATSSRELRLGDPGETYWRQRRWHGLHEDADDQDRLRPFTEFWDQHRGTGYLRQLPDPRGDWERRCKSASIAEHQRLHPRPKTTAASTTRGAAPLPTPASTSAKAAACPASPTMWISEAGGIPPGPGLESRSRWDSHRARDFNSRAGGNPTCSGISILGAVGIPPRSGFQFQGWWEFPACQSGGLRRFFFCLVGYSLGS